MNKKYITPFKNYKSNQLYYIIAADIETIVLNGSHKPFAIGWKCRELNITMYEYSKNIEDIDSLSVLNIFISELFKIRNMLTKKSKMYVYFHNLSGFDGIIMLKSLTNMGIYKIDITSRSNKIMKIVIKDSKNNTLELRDSLHLLPMSLDKLGKSFLNRPKLPIDPVFTISRIKSEKNYIIKYLLRDIEILDSVIRMYNSIIYKEFGINSYNCLTATSLSYKIYKAKYLFDNKIEIPDTVYDNFIRKAYYGGRCEAYIPKNYNGQPVYHYDFNSHYPYSMKNLIPTSIVGWVRPSVSSPIDAFTVYDVVVDVPSVNLPVLPYRNPRTKVLTFPTGTFRTFVNGVELNYAVTLGYAKVVKVHRSLKLGNPKKLFDEFITDQWNKRLEAKKVKDPREKIYKLNMNSLYGRFAMINSKMNSIIVKTDSEQEKDIYNRPGFYASYEIGEYTVCNFNTPLVGSKPVESASYVSSWITSYARMSLHAKMVAIELHNGYVYYCDTDSIACNLKIPSSNDLGRLKIESIYQRSYFLAPKMYGGLKFDGSVVLKGKGIINTQIKNQGIEFYANLYESIKKGINVPKTYKIERSFIRSFKQFEIFSGIKTYTILLNQNKRLFLYDKTGNWVSTRPVTLIRNIDDLYKYSDVIKVEK